MHRNSAHDSDDIVCAVSDLLVVLQNAPFSHSSHDSDKRRRSAYPTPHWQQSDDSDYVPSPVAYVRNTNVTATAAFQVIPEDGRGTVYVKAEGEAEGVSLTFGPTSVEVTGSTLEISMSSQGTLPDSMMVLDPLTITWSFGSSAQGPWEEAGTSDNPVYLTWAEPKTKLIGTLLHVGCEGQKVSGVFGTDDQKVLEKIWTKLQTLEIRRISDQHVLSYYGFFFVDVNGNGTIEPDVEGEVTNKNHPDLCDVKYAAPLIQEGNGQCHAWTDFMLQTLLAQGLEKINGIPHESPEAELKSGLGDAFAVENWQKEGNDPRRVIDVNQPEPPTPGEDEAKDVTGVPGQGDSPDPPGEFNNHFIVKIFGHYYDPSYGIGPFDDLKEYEDTALAGSLANDYIWFGTRRLYDLPTDNGDPNDQTDLINDYTPE